MAGCGRAQAVHDRADPLLARIDVELGTGLGIGPGMRLGRGVWPPMSTLTFALACPWGGRRARTTTRLGRAGTPPDGPDSHEELMGWRLAQGSEDGDASWRVNSAGTVLPRTRHSSVWQLGWQEWLMNRTLGIVGVVASVGRGRVGGGRRGWWEGEGSVGGRGVGGILGPQQQNQ